MALLQRWAKRAKRNRIEHSAGYYEFALNTLGSIHLGTRIIASNYFASLPHCPCTDAEARANTDVWTPGFTILGMVVFPACDSTHHAGAVSGYRSANPTENGPGQQCCYDGAGKLITAGAAAGTPDLIAPVSLVTAYAHNIVDVMTWTYLGWPLYNRYWAPNQGPAGESCPVNRKSLSLAPSAGEEMSWLSVLPRLAAQAKAAGGDEEPRAMLTLARTRYRIGDGLKAGVRCARDCYYALLHFGPLGYQRVAPGRGDPRRLEAGTPVAIPSGEGVMRVTAPAGREGFLLITSDAPIDLDGLDYFEFPTTEPGLHYTFAAYDVIE